MNENNRILDQIKRMLLSLVNDEMKEIINNEDFKKYQMELNELEQKYEKEIQIQTLITRDINGRINR